jgi:hypothetical protein
MVETLETRRLFEADPDVTRRVERVMVQLRHYGRGLTVPWEVLEAAAEGSHKAGKSYTAIEKARRRLLEETGIASYCKEVEAHHPITRSPAASAGTRNVPSVSDPGVFANRHPYRIRQPPVGQDLARRDLLGCPFLT